jgi:hypothetical protein
MDIEEVRTMNELIPDVDNDREDVLRLFNDQLVVYIEQGSVFNLFHRIEYTFCFDEKTWECKHPYDVSNV